MNGTDLSSAPASSTERIRMALAVVGLANARDVDALAPLLHPTLEVPSLVGVAPAAGYRGVDGFRRYFAEAAATNFAAEAMIQRIEVTPSGNVLAIGTLVCTLNDRVSSMPAWYVYRFRDGLVCAIETYRDGAGAREAADRS